jgi:hypothetical protein
MFCNSIKTERIENSKPTLLNTTSLTTMSNNPNAHNFNDDLCDVGYHAVTTTKCLKDKKKVARKTLTNSAVQTNRDVRVANTARCKGLNQVWSAKKGVCVDRKGRTDSTKKRAAKSKRADARATLVANANCEPGFHFGGKNKGCVKDTVPKAPPKNPRTKSANARRAATKKANKLKKQQNYIDSADEPSNYHDASGLVYDE